MKEEIDDTKRVVGETAMRHLDAVSDEYLQLLDGAFSAVLAFARHVRASGMSPRDVAGMVGGLFGGVVCVISEEG